MIYRPDPMIYSSDSNPPRRRPQRIQHQAGQTMGFRTHIILALVAVNLVLALDPNQPGAAVAMIFGGALYGVHAHIAADMWDNRGSCR